jgi:exodeoxyribonuclease-3
VKIVSWNINSLRQRLHRVTAWLEQQQPEVLCLQETKCPDDQFPRAELEAAGYQLAFSGQKGLNGVAILSKRPLEDVEVVLPGRDDDTQRRYVAATVEGVRVINVYVPNGQQVGSDAFFFKLDWLSRLQAHLRATLDPAQPICLLGDFNIAPAELDVHDVGAWEGGLHCTAHERKMIGFLLGWGFHDALRLKHPEAPVFTWFDYRDPNAVEEGRGLRIDLSLITAPLTERLDDVTVDLEERARSADDDKPSDHAPLITHLRWPA